MNNTNKTLKDRDPYWLINWSKNKDESPICCNTFHLIDFFNKNEKNKKRHCSDGFDYCECDIEKVVNGYDITIRNTPYFSKAESIPGIGDINQIKEKAFSMEIGEFSSAKVRNRFYLYKLEDIEKAGEPDSEQTRQIANKIKIDKSRQAFQEWVENLKTGAKILVDKKLL